MRTILSILLLSCLITGASAITLSENVKYVKTMEAGSSDSFRMLFTPEENEKNLQFSSVEYSCPYISVDKQPIPLKTPVYVLATIKVPKNAPNGLTDCSLEFNTPQQEGMVNFGIGVPIKLTIVNGTGIISPTATQTTAKVVVAQTSTQNVTMVESPPVMPAVVFIGIGLLVLGIIGIVLWKKKNSEPETFTL